MLPTFNNDPAAQTALHSATKEMHFYGFPSVENLQTFVRLNKQYPHTPEILSPLKTALRAAADWSALANVMRDSLSDPPTMRQLDFLGYYLNEAGRYKEAAKLLGPIEASQSDQPRIAFQLARSLIEQDHFDKAAPILERHWQSVIAVDHGGALNFRARIALHQERAQDAIADLLKSLALDPQSFETAYYLSRAYAQEGDKEASAKYLHMGDQTRQHMRDMLRWKNNAHGVALGWRQGAYADSQRIIDRMMPASDNNATKALLFALRGAINNKLGHPDQAIADAQESSRLRNLSSKADMANSEKGKELYQRTRFILR